MLAELGRAEVAVGRARRFDRLRAALDLAPDPAAHGAIAADLADALEHAMRYWMRSRCSMPRWHSGLSWTASWSLRLEALRAIAARYRAPAPGQDEGAPRAAAGELSGRTPAERLLKATVAMLAPVANAREAVAVADVIEQCWAEGDLPPDTLSGGLTALVHADELDRARLWLDDLVAGLRRRGRIADLARLVSLRGWVAHERGDLLASETDLRESFELGLALFSGPSAAHLAVTLAARGRADEALSVIADAGLDEPVLPETMIFNVVLYGRAVARAAAGRGEEALEDLLSSAAATTAGGSNGPRRRGARARRCCWRPPATTTARSPSPAKSSSWRSAGEQPGRAGSALRAGAADPRRPRAAICWSSPCASWSNRRGGSSWRRRSSTSAPRCAAAGGASTRDPLRRGWTWRRPAGATVLAERAGVELRASGAARAGRPLTGVASLTPSERRVAEHAASGLTNKQIAQALFVTLPTVETHLRHVFQKLDLRSPGPSSARRWNRRGEGDSPRGRSAPPRRTSEPRLTRPQAQ